MNKLTSSIKFRLISITFIVTLIVFSVIGFVINTRVGSELEMGAQVELSKDAQIIAKDLNSQFSQYGMLVLQMSKNPDLVDMIKDVKSRTGKRNYTKINDVAAILDDIQSTDSNVGLAWLGINAASDIVINDPTYFQPEDFNITGRPWYGQMVEEDGLTFTPPYVDAVTGDLVISIVYPIKEGGSIIGNVGIDLYLTEVSAIMESIKIGDEGYAILIASDGTVVYHPDETQIMETNLTEMEGTLGQLAGEMVEGKSGISEYTYENVTKYFAYSPIASSKWSVGTMVPKAETQNEINAFVLLNTVLFIMTILILMVAVYISTSRVLRHIPRLVDTMNAFSDGDLTQKINFQSHDEIGLIGETYNTVATKLRNVIHDALSSSDNVQKSSRTMVTISNESKQALDDVSRAINDVANGTTDQANETERSVHVMHTLSSEIEGIVEKTEEIFNKTEDVHELSNKGSQTLEALNEKSLENQKSVKTIKEIVQEMDSASNEISTIVDMINSISEQTNLLALNASIEAARAGEAGRGFAVVADEIRQLAEQTNEATEEIREKIVGIQDKSRVAVEQTDSSEKIVMKNVDIVNETADIFSEILENLNVLFEISEGSKTAAESMRRSKDDVVAFIESVSASSEETSASMEEMSASTEQQLAIMDNLANEAKQLNELAEHLHEILEQFSV